MIDPKEYAQNLFNNHYAIISSVISNYALENSIYRKLGDEILISMLAKQHAMHNISELLIHADKEEIELLRQTKFHLEEI